MGADELERAAAALEGSDPSAAAQATITRGEYVWQRGDQDSAFAYFDRARALVEGAPLSREKQYVIAQCARFLALAGRNDEALPLAEESIAMAEKLGDDDMLGDALNNRAIVRSNIGHRGWLEDSERSIELLLRTNSFRVTRAYINFGSNLVDTAADLVRGEAATREGLAIGQRMGLPSTAIRWFVGNLAELTYLAGKWDEALALAEEVLAAEYHYQLTMAHGIRAAIRLGHGEAEGAVSDAEASLRDARAIRDPQALRPALVTSAEVAYRTGETAAANGLLDELGMPEGAKGSWIVRAALLCHDLDRELAVPVDGEPRNAWSDAALAIVRGDLERAADLLEPTGARTFEAAARLRAAIAQAAAGRRPRAEAQLGRALAFYRQVGASAYAREAEALLPAAS